MFITQRIIQRSYKMSVAILLLVVAVVLFALALGTTRRRYDPPAYPLWPSFVCGGFFFWALSQLWPLLNK